MNPFKKFLQRIGLYALELCWSRNCPVCGRSGDRENRHICSACFAKLEWIESGSCCKICETPIATHVDHEFVCSSCVASKPHYDFLRSSLIYSYPIDYVIQMFKYEGSVFFTEELSEILEGTVKAKFPYEEIDSIIPVPLHKNRILKRGYNQSELLATALSHRLNRAVDTVSFIRKADTPQQARLSHEERSENVKGAFKVVRPEYIRARTILLIDDVTTSGATLNECAKVLKQAGASKVWCLTLAKVRD